MKQMLSTAGFSLVEVSLAVAVAAFALMGLLAMTTMGLRMGRLAVDDTFTSTIAQDVFSEVRVEAAKGGAAYQNLAATFDGERWTYRRDGDYLGSDPSNAEAFYMCQISITKRSDFLTEVKLELVWPNVNSFASAPNTNRYYTVLSNLEPY